MCANRPVYASTRSERWKPLLVPQREAGLRLRIGQSFSVGASGTGAYDPGEGTALTTIVFGIRPTVALP
jgi:hypothetical protein